ncbi:MAG: nucleotidyltransferase domain-containing protein [Candidatus Omnitrophota bacterium]|nr:nucleotidyltransferase domain-containing protein [Candidatus Omnitrophota bacterium]
MTPEQLTASLRQRCGSQLVSVMLFGSAAAGDHLPGQSDYNVLVVLDRLGPQELEALTDLTRSWVRAGNRPPLLFTREELVRSGEVYSIEIADMKDSRQVLFGEDVIAPLSVNPGDLRRQLEYELRSRLAKLRTGYMQLRRDRRKTLQLMTRSLSTFLVLFRAALRVYQPHVPQKKFEALEALARHVSMRTDVFHQVAQLKTSRGAGRVDHVALMRDYVQAIESIVQAVDTALHPVDERRTA